MISAAKSQNGVWKWLASILGAVIVTGSAAWLSFGANKAVSEEQVISLIQAQSPYKEDRKFISKKLEEVESRLIRIDKTLLEIMREISKL